MRTSLKPSMLVSIESNQAMYQSGVLFEVAPVFSARAKDIPLEQMKLLIASYDSDGEKAFLRAKGLLKRVFNELCSPEPEFTRMEDSYDWHAGRSAAIIINGEQIGVIGEISSKIALAFGLDVRVCLVDIDFERVMLHFKTSHSFEKILEFPEVKRDVAFVLEERIEYSAIEDLLLKTGPLVRSVELFDVYHGKGVPEGKKSMAVHIVLRSDEKTLSSEEADVLLLKIREALENNFNAQLR